MADDWFKQNAPQTTGAVGDWFASNAPPGSKPEKKSPTLPPQTGDIIASALPWAGATLGTILAPEGFLPAIGGAMLGGAGGSLIGQGLQSKPPESLNELTTNVGNEALAQGVGEGVGGAANAMLGKLLGSFVNPERLYQSALKPTGTPAQAERAVATGLREQVPLDAGASGVVRNRINAINNQIENIISTNPQSIPPAQYVGNVQKRLDLLRNQWAKDPTQGQQFVKQIDEAERQFLLQHGNPQPLTVQVGNQPALTVQPQDMPLATLRQQAQPIAADELQAIKKQGYKSVRRTSQSSWEPGSNPAVTTDITKGITGAAREELQKLYPQLATLNPQEGSLIELEKAVGKFAKREANKQTTPYFIFPLAGSMLGAAGGGYEGGALGAAGGVAAHFIRSAIEDPAVKSKLAIALNKAAQTTIGKATKAVSPYVLPGAARAITGSPVDLLNPQPIPPP